MKKILALMMLCGFLAAGSAAADDEIKWDLVPDETKTALYEAQQDMNDGRMDKALKDLLKFQQKRAKYNHFLVEFNIGTLYGLQKQPDKAIEHLEKAAEMEKSYSPIWLNLGKLYYQLQVFDKAGSALEQSFRCSVKQETDMLYMAMASYYQAGDLARATALGEELVQVFRRDSPEIVSLLAGIYIQTGNFSSAVTMLETLLEKTPSDDKLWKMLAQAHFKNQKYREAAIAYETYGYLRELSRDELIVMGDLFTMVGVPLRAAQYYELALQNGGTADEQEKLSVAYYCAYEFDKASAAVDGALKEKPTVERMLLKAQLCYLQERFVEAQQHYVKAAQAMSKDGHEWLMAGYCALRGGNTSRARELLSKAAEFPTQRQDALAMLKALQPAEDFKKSMQEFKDAQQLL
jgi:tetratricopeptide (TPR) repeat protein